MQIRKGKAPGSGQLAEIGVELSREPLAGTTNATRAKIDLDKVRACLDTVWPVAARHRMHGGCRTPKEHP